MPLILPPDPPALVQPAKRDLWVPKAPAIIKSMPIGFGMFAPPPAAPPPFSLDASARSAGAHGGATSMTATLSTSFSNDYIVVFVCNEANVTNNTYTTVSSVTCSAVSSFTRRGSAQQFNNSNFTRDFEVWGGLASGGLSSSTITVNLTGATLDNGVFIVVAVSDVNATPWDANASLPKSATASSTSAPSVTGVSTTSSGDLVFAAFASVAGNVNNTDSGDGSVPPTGYTLVHTAIQNGGSRAASVGVSYKIVSGTISSQTLTYGDNVNGDWGMIADALCHA